MTFAQPLAGLSDPLGSGPVSLLGVRARGLASQESFFFPDPVAVAFAGVVSFLAGPDGGWVNGQVVRANGGFA